jgi:hypothetical protein
MVNNTFMEHHLELLLNGSKSKRFQAPEFGGSLLTTVLMMCCTLRAGTEVAALGPGRETARNCSHLQQKGKRSLLKAKRGHWRLRGAQ